MFGANQNPGGGFNFGTPASSTGTAPGAGFPFGGSGLGGTATTSAGGFSFGGANLGGTATTSNPGGFSLGGSTLGGAATANTGGFSFGATAPTATASTGAGTGFSFAGSTGGGGAGGLPGFGASATATPTATSAAAPAGFNFGLTANKAATTAASTTGLPTSGFGLGASTASGFTGLGTALSKNNNSSLPGTVTATTAATGTGGFNFGNAATPKSTPGAATLSGLLATPASQPSTASTTTASTGFSLAGTAPAASATSGFSFGPTLGGTSSLGQPAAPTPASTTASATTSLGAGLGLAGFTAASSSAATVGNAAIGTGANTTLSGVGSVKGTMTFRQLEETINKWTTELEQQESCFLDQATQVNAWDRIVMDNGDKIIQLNKDLERVKLDQQKLDHELDFVHSQHTELEELLTPLESALDSLPPISHTQHAHLEREHTYTLAESLDSQLKRMSQDLKEIVERLNSSNNKPDDNDPLQQVTKILNAHVVSLMWVDRNTANLQRRTEEISKMMDFEKKEQERNFRMAYS